MDNAEKYEEVFGFKPDVTGCISNDCKHCPIESNPCGKLDTMTWWYSNYRGTTSVTPAQEDKITYKGQKVGDFEINDSGIFLITEIDDYAGYVSKLVMTREAFVAAYNKYIKTTDGETFDETNN